MALKANISARGRRLLPALCMAAAGASMFVRCASIAEPLGGPRDSLPPLIVRTDPAPKSTNFGGRRITLDFNEYVALKNQQQQVMISPPGVRRPTLTVKGRSIQIDFEEELLPDMTYRIDFGYSIVDNNESNPLGGYAFLFSTGPQIDTLVMSGQVVDMQTRDSVVQAIIFYFDASVDTASYDSTLFVARPDALFRTDSSGLFLADILRDKPYRIYAVLDKNNNQKYEAGTDYVAMLDSAYNPTQMPPFEMWIEAARRGRGMRRTIRPPQLRFELFLEEPPKRQTILESKRPERQQLQIVFNARQAEIVAFEPKGTGGRKIDSTWLKRSAGQKGDTVWYWIAPPTAEDVAALPDTIRAGITFVTQDSVWNRTLRTEELIFTHRIIDPNERPRRAANAEYADSIRKVKEAKRQAKLQKKWLRKARKISRRRGDGRLPDSVLLRDSTLFQQVSVDTTRRDRPARGDEDQLAQNPFRYKVQAANPLNPEKHIRLWFDYPLRGIDSSRITLARLTDPRLPAEAGGAGGNVASRRSLQAAFEQPAEGGTEEKIETPMPHRLVVDTSATVQWLRIEADWETGAEYRLLIPDSVFTDIAFHRNDTLQSTFRVADTTKFGTIVLKLRAAEAVDSVNFTDSVGCEYLLELLDVQSNRVVETIRHAKAGGVFRLRYLPASRYRLRVTEDRNGNGVWDTGILVKRQPPERVRIWNPEGKAEIVTRENWESIEEVNLTTLFPD